MDKIITGRNIVKTFKHGTEQTKVLNGVSAEIEKGEFVAVMGPSGSGKSTLLFALSGMDDISSGSVRFGASELSGMKENELADVRRKKMGFIFQQPTMLKNLNILDNIILPAAQEGDMAALQQRAKALMQKTGIAGLEERDITEVSGGQLQRAGICRALMNAPEIIFADEPTGNLDPDTSSEIMQIFQAINRRGTTVLIATHDRAMVDKLRQRVIQLRGGFVVRDQQNGGYAG